MRQLMLDLGDLRATRGDFAGELDLRAFQSAIRLARQFQVDAQFLGLRLGRGRLFLDLIELGAQGLVGRARFVQHAGEAERLRLFLLKRAQRRVKGRDDFIEGFLEFVEFADLAADVGQQIAQDFVFFADARADVGEILAVMLAIAVTAVHASGFAFAIEQIRQLSHDKVPHLTPQSLVTPNKVFYTFGN